MTSFGKLCSMRNPHRKQSNVFKSGLTGGQFILSAHKWQHRDQQQHQCSRSMHRCRPVMFPLKHWTVIIKPVVKFMICFEWRHLPVWKWARNYHSNSFSSKEQRCWCSLCITATRNGKVEKLSTFVESSVGTQLWELGMGGTSNTRPYSVQ